MVLKMKIGIILNSNEAETAWNCFRFGNEALANKHNVKLFLLGKGVEAEDIKDNKVPYLDGAIKKFLKNNGTILVCGTCLKSRNKEKSRIGEFSTMNELLKVVEESDRVLAFG